MPDYFTQFSCLLDVRSEANARRALDLFKAYEAELERDGVCPGFELEIDEPSVTALWFHSDDYGEPVHVVDFVLRCAEAFDLKGHWGFSWAHTCSKPQLDAFGGGAGLLDLGARKCIARINCESWLELQARRRSERKSQAKAR
jgi:hypothetical protein